LPSPAAASWPAAPWKRSSTRARHPRKKNAPQRRCPCGTDRQSKGQAQRAVLTAAGLVTARRRYLVCPACGSGAHPRDAWWGLDGFLSGHARRLACLAAASWSFDRASALLEEFCGLRVSDTAIRAAAVAAGSEVRAWQRASPAPAAAFAAAAGDVAFSTDGTHVNTLGGWREMRLAIFAKRPAGGPAEPWQWDERSLPPPSVRVLFGGVWTAERFGPQWRAWAGRLGVRQTAEVTVLADGAKWIWAQAERNFPGAAGVLDIYHAGTHLYDAAQALYGEGAAEGPAWAEARRRTLLSGGAAALDAELAAQQGRTRSARKRRAVQDLRDFLAPHERHTGYAGRLRRGRSIGSGMVEGACKTVVGRRLKQTGARWRVRHAESVVALCGLLYGDLWDAYWAGGRN